MTSFGPSPIPQTPGAVQSSFIAQQSSAARAREKDKPKDADKPRSLVRDEVRISDPLEGDGIDPKPDAVEEWKHRRNRGQRQGQQADETTTRRSGGDDAHIDIRA